MPRQSLTPVQVSGLGQMLDNLEAIFTDADGLAITDRHVIAEMVAGELGAFGFEVGPAGLAADAEQLRETVAQAVALGRDGEAVDGLNLLTEYVPEGASRANLAPTPPAPEPEPEPEPEPLDAVSVIAIAIAEMLRRPRRDWVHAGPIIGALTAAGYAIVRQGDAAQGDAMPASVRDAITYAVADFRQLAIEAGERDPKTSPALRAAERLAAILPPTPEAAAADPQLVTVRYRVPIYATVDLTTGEVTSATLDADSVREDVDPDASDARRVELVEPIGPDGAPLAATLSRAGAMRALHIAATEAWPQWD